MSSIIRIRRLDLIGSNSRIGRLEMFIHLFSADIQFFFSYESNERKNRILWIFIQNESKRHDKIWIKID